MLLVATSVRRPSDGRKVAVLPNFVAPVSPSATLPAAVCMPTRPSMIMTVLMAMLERAAITNVSVLSAPGTAVDSATLFVENPPANSTGLGLKLRGVPRAIDMGPDGVDEGLTTANVNDVSEHDGRSPASVRRRVSVAIVHVPGKKSDAPNPPTDTVPVAGAPYVTPVISFTSSDRPAGITSVGRTVNVSVLLLLGMEFETRTLRTAKSPANASAAGDVNGIGVLPPIDSVGVTAVCDAPLVTSIVKSVVCEELNVLPAATVSVRVPVVFTHTPVPPNTSALGPPSASVALSFVCVPLSPSMTTTVPAAKSRLGRRDRVSVLLTPGKSVDAWTTAREPVISKGSYKTLPVIVTAAFESTAILGTTP
eukprot:Opistho-1_new@41139